MRPTRIKTGRIAVGGWQHETNTFAPIKADYTAFERADEWPALGVGEQMLDQVRGVHLPITGAIDALAESDYELVPLLWCCATPCAHVTRHAFETICQQFLQLIEQDLPLDGIYLDLHGAMVCEHLQDGEGEFLKRVRQQVGDEIPIVVSLDLHANITPLMVEQATVLDVYRTYPHVDMGETGYRAAKLLISLISTGERWLKSFHQLDFLMALNWGCTLVEPCRSIYQRLPGCINHEVKSLSFASGFHLSDIHDVGPSVVAYATSQQAADRAVASFADYVNAQKPRFYEKFWQADEGVARALEIVAEKGGTVVLADTQDNPGGGGPGDTTGLLQALIARQPNPSGPDKSLSEQAGFGGAVFGVLADSETVQAAIRAGTGNRFNAQLGGKSGIPGHKPFQCDVTVERLTDGNFTATGPMYRGAHMALGPCALLRVGDIRIMLASKPVQTADQSIFRHVGIEPGSMALVALKSSVHFRNDFTDLATAILIITSPGVVVANPADLHYRNIRPNVEIIQA